MSVPNPFNCLETRNSWIFILTPFGNEYSICQPNGNGKLSTYRVNGLFPATYAIVADRWYESDVT